MEKIEITKGRVLEYVSNTKRDDESLVILNESRGLHQIWPKISDGECQVQVINYNQLQFSKFQKCTNTTKYTIVDHYCCFLFFLIRPSSNTLEIMIEDALHRARSVHKKCLCSCGGLASKYHRLIFDY